MEYFYLSVLLVAVVALALLVRRQLRDMRRTDTERQRRSADEAARRQRGIDSIRVLARSILADQVEYSEACIRIKVLMDGVAPELSRRETYAVFDAVYEALSAHPTHEARQQLEQSQRRQLDFDRAAVERQHGAAIRVAAEALLREPQLAPAP